MCEIPRSLFPVRVTGFAHSETVAVRDYIAIAWIISTAIVDTYRRALVSCGPFPRIRALQNSVV